MTNLDIATIPQWYLQRAVDDMVPGLSIYVRDTDLSPEEIASYRAGQILEVADPLCATKRVLGPSGNMRFAIMSNHMEDLGAVAAETFEAHAEDAAPSLRDLISAGADLPGQEEEPGGYALGPHAGCWRRPFQGDRRVRVRGRHPNRIAAPAR